MAKAAVKKSGKWKYPTGFCSNGQHEGTKPKSASGTPMRVCLEWDKCPCKCHAEITSMYELTGMDREPPEQSVEYLAHVRDARHQFVMPSRTEWGTLDGLSSSGGTDGHPTDERPVVTPERDAYAGASGPPHGTVQPVFTPTPTGRRARGQLEFDVLTVCDEFMRDVYEVEHCTPKFVSEQIAKKYAIEPPSTGAINAVWDRWEKLGFATQAKKPSRLTGFTADGSLNTLAMMKDRAKRDKKRIKTEIRHGVRRPT